MRSQNTALRPEVARQAWDEAGERAKDTGALKPARG